MRHRLPAPPRAKPHPRQPAAHQASNARKRLSKYLHEEIKIDVVLHCTDTNIQHATTLVSPEERLPKRGAAYNFYASKWSPISWYIAAIFVAEERYLYMSQTDHAWWGGLYAIEFPVASYTQHRRMEFARIS